MLLVGVDIGRVDVVSMEWDVVGYGVDVDGRRASVVGMGRCCW